MKLSFSIPSRSSSSSRPRPSSATPETFDPTREVSKKRTHFVTEFDPSQALDRSADQLKCVIAPLENTNSWRAKRMKNLIPSSDPASSESDVPCFVVDQLGSNPSAAASNTSYGLNIRSKTSSDSADVLPSQAAGDAGDDRAETRISDGERFQIDMASLPDDIGIDEYDKVPVTDFSKAVLEGYGWKEGQGIGRNSKQDVPVVEQKRWAGMSGLGFNPDAPESRNKEKGKKTISASEEKPPLPPPPPPPPSSAQRHSDDSSKTKIVRITSGKHAGLKATVMMMGGQSNNEPAILSLLSNKEMVRVGADMIAELGSPEEERYLKKIKHSDLQDGNGKRDERKKDTRSRDIERKRHKTEAKSDNGCHHESVDPVFWLRSQIKIRVISKKFKGGRLFLKKGVVTDVVGPMTCDISMDENREFLQGVNQDILETVLPQCGGPVLVLYGTHKGVFGKLMEKDKEKETAIVRVADSHDVIKVRMEQIAEFVGDPDELGY